MTKHLPRAEREEALAVGFVCGVLACVIVALLAVAIT